MKTCINCEKPANAKIKVTTGRLTQQYGLCLEHYQSLLEKGDALFHKQSLVAPKGWAKVND